MKTQIDLNNKCILATSGAGFEGGTGEMEKNVTHEEKK